jgi:hypothetical protein
MVILASVGYVLGYLAELTYLGRPWYPGCRTGKCRYRSDDYQFRLLDNGKYALFCQCGTLYRKRRCAVQPASSKRRTIVGPSSGFDEWTMIGKIGRFKTRKSTTSMPGSNRSPLRSLLGPKSWSRESRWMEVKAAASHSIKSCALSWQIGFASTPNDAMALTISFWRSSRSSSRIPIRWMLALRAIAKMLSAIKFSCLQQKAEECLRSYD